MRQVKVQQKLVKRLSLKWVRLQILLQIKLLKNKHNFKAWLLNLLLDKRECKELLKLKIGQKWQAVLLELDLRFNKYKILVVFGKIQI